MGCVSSNLLSGDDDFRKLRSSALGHHIVSLTSSTYGLLNLDRPSSPSSSPIAAADFDTTTTTTPPSLPVLCSRQIPDEVINSWELMSGLDTESFRLSPIITCKEPQIRVDKENVSPNLTRNGLPFQSVDVPPPKRALSELEFSKPSLLPSDASRVSEGSDYKPGFGILKPAEDSSVCSQKKLDGFPALCPPNGETKIVIYTTSLRGIRKTFEDCNKVRSVMEGLGVVICERDVSMDKGFREELRQLMMKDAMVLPRVFIKGKYIGGAEELLRIAEEGWMEDLLQGLPKKKAWQPCEGCGNVRFVPCFSCNGSCKIMVANEADEEEEEPGCRTRKEMVVRCPECNENGLVLCPICS